MEVHNPVNCMIHEQEYLISMKEEGVSENGDFNTIRKARNRTSAKELFGGSIIIGHRPGRHAIRVLGHKGVTHIVTLMSEAEGAKSIEEAVREAKICWIWFPMKSGNPPGKKRFAELKKVFAEILNALQSGGMVYIHCSAGIHRTGMIVYAFLRYSGIPVDHARSMLTELRLVTAESVGEERLAWGDRLVNTISKEDY